MNGNKNCCSETVQLTQEQLELARKLIDDPFSHRVRNKDETLRQYLIREVACETMTPGRLETASTKIAEARSEFEAKQGITHG